MLLSKGSYDDCRQCNELKPSVRERTPAPSLGYINALNRSYQSWDLHVPISAQYGVCDDKLELLHPFYIRPCSLFSPRSVSRASPALTLVECKVFHKSPSLHVSQIQRCQGV